MFKTKKAQTGGLITGLIFGIASLVIGVIVAFVLVSTLSNAGLLDESKSNAAAFNTTILAVNETGTVIPNSTLPGASCTVVYATNKTGDGLQIQPANYTVSGCIIKFAGSDTDATSYNNTLWNVTTTTVYDGIEKRTSDRLTANFTKGVDNVSNKIPTILLIAAIVLILGVLVLLVGAWQRMRIGGGGI